MSSIATLRDVFRRLGVPGGLLWVTARTLHAVTFARWRLHRYWFVAQPVADGALAAASPRAIVVRAIAPDDPLVGRFPRPQEVIAARFRMGAICLVAERQSEFVGFLWLKERSYPEDEVRCLYMLDPPGAAAWDFDVYVEPTHRGGRTFARLWEGANAWLREHGYRWTLSRISAFNPESIAAHRRLGIRRVGAATFLTAGRTQIAFLDRAPFVHVGWRVTDVPTLHLRAPPDDGARYNARPGMQSQNQ
jgi:GNAT superfamily N-acetyltransferase